MTDRMSTWKALLKETEQLLQKWKHPDPYAHPTAPGGMTPAAEKTARCPANADTHITGSKYERNLPAHILDRKPLPGTSHWLSSAFTDFGAQLLHP